MNISLVEKDIAEIELIKPLWEELNHIHFNKSVYFKNKYKNFTFDKRMKSIYEKAKSANIKIDMLLDNDSDNYVGYCLSSIEGGLGEIESIFIKDEYRKLGLGDKLMKNALNWFKLNKVANIQISVVYGNDEALPFYEHYGFRIGNYTLKNSN